MSRTARLVLAGTVAVLGGCAGGDRAFVNSVKNTPAPDFELTDLAGKSVRLSDVRGRPVVLAFFAYG